ncbi:MAG: hypothetical protein K0B01_12265 [Syntrophobacterales bacterium]|nr:hypothetical protein [Syntrophobacterales bacterium]
MVKSIAEKLGIGKTREGRSESPSFAGEKRARHRALGIIFRLLPLLTALMVVAAGSAMAQEFDHGYHLYDGALKKYVDNGTVNYTGLKTDAGALDRYLTDAAAVPENQFKSWTESRQLAFLSNLYNAATLRLILDHYPVKSIKDIGSIFNPTTIHDYSFSTHQVFVSYERDMPGGSSFVSIRQGQ